MAIDQTLSPLDMLLAARESWDLALTLGEKHGYRNAQATVLAPTAAEADAQFRAQLRFDQAIGAQRFLGIVIVEVGFTPSGCDPNGSQRRKPSNQSTSISRKSPTRSTALRKRNSTSL